MQFYPHRPPKFNFQQVAKKKKSYTCWQDVYLLIGAYDVVKASIDFGNYTFVTLKLRLTSLLFRRLRCSTPLRNLGTQLMSSVLWRAGTLTGVIFYLIICLSPKTQSPQPPKNARLQGYPWGRHPRIQKLRRFVGRNDLS